MSVRARLASMLAVEIPPHSYALLRIVLGSVGLVSLLGLTPISLFWSIDGLTPLPGQGLGLRAWIAAQGLGFAAGAVLFSVLVCSFTAMTIGLWSDVAVFLCFIGLVAQSHWNSLPLSSAHQVMSVLVFCLLWAETGAVWSLDARWGRTRAAAQAAWPLWLMRFQVALVYFSSGLYKLGYPGWRDGSTVHWALNLNAFHRFPWTIPGQLAPLELLLTWGTLVFELFFWLLVLFRRTRPWALLGGTALHLGLFATLELGPFSPLMIASYICYLDPQKTADLFRSRAK